MKGVHLLPPAAEWDTEYEVRRMECKVLRSGRKGIEGRWGDMCMDMDIDIATNPRWSLIHSFTPLFPPPSPPQLTRPSDSTLPSLLKRETRLFASFKRHINSAYLTASELAR